MVRSRNGFTLVELITVIAVIVILIGMLFPALRGAMNRAKITTTTALIARLESALSRYNSDWRDYPPSTAGGGGTLADNIGLYQALMSEEEINGPYEGFSDKEILLQGTDTLIVDAWKHPILYCKFTDYDANWATTQPWRFEKKKYEFQLISPGVIWDQLDKNKSGLVENSELNNLTTKQVNDILRNW